AARLGPLPPDHLPRAAGRTGHQRHEADHRAAGRRRPAAAQVGPAQTDPLAARTRKSRRLGGAAGDDGHEGPRGGRRRGRCRSREGRLRTMLKIDDISKTFFPGTVNERKALQDLSLELAESDFVTVIGSNGAGKSTLLNTISGRLPIDSGSIRIDGAEVSRIPEHRRAKYLGRVFQGPMAGTAPDLTIEQNLSLALKRGQSRGLGRGTTSARREHFKDELATLELGLENRLKTKVGLLS